MEIIGEKAATSQLSSTTACSKFCLAYLKVHRLLTRKRHIKKSQNTRALPTQTFFTIPHFESNEDKSTSAHLKFQINKCSLSFHRGQWNVNYEMLCLTNSLIIITLLTQGPSTPLRLALAPRGIADLHTKPRRKLKRKRSIVILKITFWSFKYMLLVRSPINDPYLGLNSHETIVRGSFSSRDREVDFSVTTVLEPPKNSMAGRWLKAFFFPHILTASQG